MDLEGAAALDAAARGRIAGAMHRACRESGFFYVAHHGVDTNLIANQFIQAKRFFDLPLNEKMALDMKKSAATAGYEPMGGQILDSQDAASPAAPPVSSCRRWSRCSSRPTRCTRRWRRRWGETLARGVGAAPGR